MFQIFFGEIVRGRVRPLAYLGYTVLLSIGLFAVIAVVGFAFSSAMGPAGSAGGPGASQSPAAVSDAMPAPPAAPSERVGPPPRPDRVPVPIVPDRPRSPIATAIAIPVVAVYAFGIVNLTAKRIRDIGLPGWPGVGVLVLLGAVLGAIFGGPGAAGVQFISSLALILVPSDTLRREGQSGSSP